MSTMTEIQPNKKPQEVSRGIRDSICNNLHGIDGSYPSPLYWTLKHSTGKIFHIIGYCTGKAIYKKSPFQDKRLGFYFFHIQVEKSSVLTPVSKRVISSVKIKKEKYIMFRSRWKAKDRAYKLYCEKMGKEFHSLHREISDERKKELSDRFKLQQQIKRIKRNERLENFLRPKYPYSEECPFCENRIEIIDRYQKDNPISCPKCNKQFILR